MLIYQINNDESILVEVSFRMYVNIYIDIY